VAQAKKIPRAAVQGPAVTPEYPEPFIKHAPALPRIQVESAFQAA